MAAPLKVFRTPIGFHDAYVAAPSRKAALAAWGADADLFARGAAEQVTDPRLTEAPLADPGKVIRVPRGSAAEHLAEAAKKPRASKAGRSAKERVAQEPATQATPKRRRPPPPRPSRADLDAAETELEQQDRSFTAALQDLEAERARIAEKIADLRRSNAQRRARLQDRVDRARADFDTAMARWRED